MKIMRNMICLSIIGGCIPLWAMEAELKRVEATQKLCEVLSLFGKTTRPFPVEKDLSEDRRETSGQDSIRLPEVQLVVSKNSLLRAVWCVESGIILVYEEKTWKVIERIELEQQEIVTLKSFSFNDAEDQLIIYYGDGKEKSFDTKIPIDVSSRSWCITQ